ncbi:unnamed protein product [Eretmochelys imbricata]
MPPPPTPGHRDTTVLSSRAVCHPAAQLGGCHGNEPNEATSQLNQVQEFEKSKVSEQQPC